MTIVQKSLDSEHLGKFTVSLHPAFEVTLGAMICIAGIFNLVQELLDHLVNSDIFKGNPVPVDLGLLVSSVLVGGAIWGYVRVQSRRRRTVK